MPEAGRRGCDRHPVAFGPIEVLAIPLLVVSFFCVACAIGVVLNARSATDRGCLWALGLAATPMVILFILLVRIFA